MTDLTNYQRRRKTTYVRYERCFTSEQGGFSFPVSEDGDYLHEPGVNELGYQNFLDCLAGKHPELTDLGVVRQEYVSDEPAHGECVCGWDVGLYDPLWNQCECGRWYNLMGQEVQAPHSGPYETGEYLSDIYLGEDY